MYKEDYEYQCHHFEEQIMRIIYAMIIEDEEYRASD